MADKFILGFPISEKTASSVMFQDGTNVGIGTVSPEALLSLGSAIDAQKLLLYDNGPTSNYKYGFGIQSAELRQFFPNSATAKMTFGTIDDSDGTTYSEKMRIDSAGDVNIPNGSLGVGITTTPNSKLQVWTTQGNTAGSNGLIEFSPTPTTRYFQFRLNDNADFNIDRTFSSASSEAFTIQRSTGNVGIGTTTPSTLLSLGNSIDAQKLSLFDGGPTNNNKYGFGIQSGELRQFFPSNASVGMTFGTIDTSDGTAYSEKMRIDSSGNATFTGNVIVNGNGIDIDNNDDVRLRFDNASVFKAGLQVATTVGDMIAGSDINDFCIRANENMLFSAGGNVEKMRILANGYVGIGTTSPQQLLHINNTSGDFGAEAVLRGSTSTGTPKSEIAFKRASSADGAEMVLRTSNSSGTIQDVITLDTVGNVGIGTDDPSDILHIEKNGTTSYATTTIRNANSTAYLNIGVAGSSVADTALRNNAYIIVPTAADLLFRTSDVERIRILSSGGITFNGDTSTSNALDDYEEGTWTPSFSDLTVTGTVSFSGTYTKIGNQVFYTAQILRTSGDITSQASLTLITNLPFTVGGATSVSGGVARLGSLYVEGGMVNRQSTTQAWLPAVSATPQTVVMSGTYTV